MTDSAIHSDGARGRRWRDGAATALLVAAAAAYLARGPRELYHFDEGLILYEAKRVLDGEVIYRDFFEIISPGTLYVVAAAFRLFGTSQATARGVDAVLQILILLAVYRLCRLLGVRRALALPVALCHLALASLFMPMVTPHWFGALLTLAALRLALAPPGCRRAAGLGLVTGLLAVFQHQKAVMIGAAGVAVLCAEAWLAGGDGRDRWRTLGAALAGWLAGAAVVVAPVGAALAWAAGLPAMFDGLVRFPLQHYRGAYNRPGWGAYMPLRHVAAAARVVAALPALAPLDLGRAVAGWRRGDVERARTLFVLAVFSAGATLSILYNPDALHLAIAAPVQLVLAAELLESMLARWQPSAARAAGWAAAVLLLTAAAVQLEANLRWRRALFRFPLDTAFGPVDFRTAEEVALVRAVRAGLAAAPRRELLVYPYYASLYLLADATNPTRFQVLLPGYSPPAHVREAIAALDARQVPYVVVQTVHVKWKEDAMVRYLDAHYDRVPLPMVAGEYPTFALFRRRSP